MVKKLVLDSSVIIKWLNNTNEENIDKADVTMSDALKGSVELVAPELAKYEIGNVLLKSKELTPTEAFTSLGTAYALPITFVTESEDLAKETFELAYKYAITYYDAAFLSLAKKYDVQLITENIKHQQRSQDVIVTALKDY